MTVSNGKCLRIFCTAIFAAIFVMLLGGINASADVYFSDEAGLYSEEDKSMILERMESCSDETGWNIGIATTLYGTGSQSGASRLADSYYEKAFGANSSGALYLCDIDYRYVTVYGSANDYIYGSRLNRMLDKINDYYMDYDDLNAALAFISAVESAAKGGSSYYGSLNSEYIFPAVICALLAAVICIIVVFTRYRKYEKVSAVSYIRDGSVNITGRSDRFVREYLIRTDNGPNGGRGGHGGGYHGGGGGHHGGGGRGGRR